MNELLPKKLTEGRKPSELSEEEQTILEVISTNKITSPIEIAELTNIEESKVIEILNNDDFYNLVCANSLSKMRLAYHSKAIPRLIEDLDNSVKFYDSYDRLTKAIGAVKERDNDTMKVSLEVLLKEKGVEKNINPRTKENLNTVYEKPSGNIFSLIDNSANESKPSHKDLEFEFEEE